MNIESPYKRKNLATAYCDSLAGKGIVNTTSGLFIAGPRRVGKTTFLLEDLLPTMIQRNWLPIYVDLWSNKQMDPANLIVEAIKKKIFEFSSKLKKLSNNLILNKINLLKTIEIDFSKLKLPDHLTLVDLMTALIKISKKDIVLVIDEAQHALTTKSGINVMYALKSARDQINLAPDKHKLLLVMTGSNRDKLGQLVIKKDQPFYGCDISSFPLLGKDFTDYFTKAVNTALASDNQFTEESIWETFQIIGHRPEMLRRLVGQVALNHKAGVLPQLLKNDALLWSQQMWEEFEKDFFALSSLQQAIITLLIREKQNWLPFSEESLAYYKKSTGKEKLTISTVQTAIQSLRDRGLIWQSSRGQYALEDESFAEWFKHTFEKD